MDKKHSALIKKIKNLKQVCIAFSGGVDSTYLLYTATKALPKANILAISVNSVFIAKSEKQNVLQFIKQHQIPHEIIFIAVTEDPMVVKNDARRCYYCKSAVFKKIKALANHKGYRHILDGTHFDDTLEIRPGKKALKELAIQSPLLDLKFTKSEIRALSKKLKLPTHNKPSQSCLATRIPTETPITKTALSRIEKAELYLKKQKFSLVRVRDHFPLARIELPPSEIQTAAKKIDPSLFKKLGYRYVTLDLIGYTK